MAPSAPGSPGGRPILLDDLSVWDGRVPVGLIGRAGSVDERRRALLAFARQVTGAPDAVVLHEAGRPPALLGADAEYRLSSASRDGLGAWLIGRDPLGIDVERIGSPHEMAPGVLHPGERVILALLPEHRRPAVFATIWACKEAYLKARGTGLLRDPASFRIDLDAGSPVVRDGPIRVELAVERRLWREAEFVVAVAILPRNT